MPTKEQVEKELQEAKQKIAVMEAQAATAAEPRPDAFMKDVMMMMKAQNEATQAQLRAQHEENRAQLNTQREIADAQIKAQQDQMKALMGELADSKKKASTSGTPSRFKVSPPSQLTPEMSVAKIKAWRKAWQDYAEMCQLEKMTLKEQQALFRSCLSLDMRDILEERIGTREDQKPEAILDEIEKYIRKKRSVVLDMVDFDNRKQKSGESFDAYLVAIQQIAQDADLTCDHCPDCKVACLDRRLAARLISGISDERTRTKLLEEEKFPSKDRVIEICTARESARKNHKEKWGNQGNIQSVKKRTRSREHSRSREGKHQNDEKCQYCGNKKHVSKEECPARDRTCKNCEKKGHFSHCCRKPKKQQDNSKQKKQDGQRSGRIKRIDRVGSNSPAVSVLTSDTKTNKSLGWQSAIADTGAEVSVGSLEFMRKMGVSKRSCSRHQLAWRLSTASRSNA